MKGLRPKECVMHTVVDLAAIKNFVYSWLYPKSGYPLSTLMKVKQDFSVMEVVVRPLCLNHVFLHLHAASGRSISL